MAISRPVIGITTYGPEGDLDSFSAPKDYVDAIAMAGGIPFLLPPSSVPIPEVLDAVDGVLLTGGGDLNPSTYGGPSHETLYGMSQPRDQFELALCKALIPEDTPVFGICRGMQVMNVAAGGDLEVHLPDVRGDEVSHRLPPRKPTHHLVTLLPKTMLTEIFQKEEFSVCSWHHQEVKHLGQGLNPIAHAADGVIEGLMLDPHRFFIGVQWHPEMQVADDPLQRRIFDAFIDAAKGTQR